MFVYMVKCMHYFQVDSMAFMKLCQHIGYVA